MEAAGNPNVSVKIYKGAHHGWEQTGAVSYLAKAENYSKCKAYYEDDGAMTMSDPAGPTLMKGTEIFAWRRSHCMTIGAHVGGGNEKLKREAINGLTTFLRGTGF